LTAVHYQPMSPTEVAELAKTLAKAQEKQNISLNELAKRAGVNQPMAHRVKAGKIQVRTPNVQRLELYVRITLQDYDSPDVVRINNSILGFLSSGGSVDGLVALLDAYTLSRRH
jgi:predicted transcriptional regulator